MGEVSGQDGLRPFFFGRLLLSWSQTPLLSFLPWGCTSSVMLLHSLFLNRASTPWGDPRSILLLQGGQGLPYCWLPAATLSLGVGAWEREKIMLFFFSVFLPWHAMRLTDISKCLFPECCDKTKPVLTGTCSLFPSWSLICHCWRLEDLNGSETDTSLGLLPNARSNLYVSRVFCPCWIYWRLEEIFIILICLTGGVNCLDQDCSP